MGFAADANAQQSGVQLGRYRLVPRVFAGLGYDSNVFYQDDNNVESPTSSAVAIVRPSVEVSSAKSANLGVDLDVGLRYLSYLSDNEAVSAQDGFDVDGKLGVTFNRRGGFALRLSDRFVRTNTAPFEEGTDSYQRIQNEVAAALLIQPGGRVITGTLEAGVQMVRYQTESLSDLDQTNYRLSQQFSWKFLPKTQFVIRAEERFIRYDSGTRQVPGDIDCSGITDANALNECNALNELNGALSGTSLVVNPDSSPVRVRAGFTGLLTKKISFAALGGWANTFTEQGENFNGFVGELELNYEIGPASRASLGYYYDMSPSTFSGFYNSHKVSLGFNQQIAGRVDLELRGMVDYRAYGTVENVEMPTVTCDNENPCRHYSTTNRVDPFVNAKAELVYRLGDIGRLATGYKYEANLTDFEVRTPVQVSTARYQKHLFSASAGLEW